MKIAVDFQCAYGRRTGIGVFAKTLIEAIKKQAPANGFAFGVGKSGEAGRDMGDGFCERSTGHGSAFSMFDDDRFVYARIAGD